MAGLPDDDEATPDFKKGQVRPWVVLVGALVFLALAVVGVLQLTAPPRREASPQPPPGTRAKPEEGCPCGCDHSEAMAGELRAAGRQAALDAIATTLRIIAEREDAGYITEAMVEHRLRLLGVQGDLASPIRDRGVPSTGEPLFSREDPVAEDDRLRVRAALTAHGETTEIVRGREKLLRASFRLGMEVTNLTGATLTVAVPTIASAGSIAFPISRWYVLGSDGRPWDGVLEAGGVRRVNVIGYLGEPVKPGTALETAVRLASLTLRVSTRARHRWNRAE